MVRLVGELTRLTRSARGPAVAGGGVSARPDPVAATWAAYGSGMGMHAGRFGLRAARLFDGDTGIIDRPLVIVADGLIEAVTSGDSPADLPVTDLGDATLLPGLIDTHVHLGGGDMIGALDVYAADLDETSTVRRMEHNAKVALAAGVTTVRDLGDRAYVSLDLRSRSHDDPSLPEVLCAGPPITITAGHCHFMGGCADSVDDVRLAVRDRAEHGCDVVKVMATGGAMTPTTQLHEAQYSAEILGALVEEAHRHGIRVTAHAHGVAGIANAVAAGVDGIEHCSFITADGPRGDPALMGRLAAAGTNVCVTAGRAPAPPSNSAFMAMAEEVMAVRKEIVAAGVRLIGGTDAGIGPAKPFDVMPLSMMSLVESGMRPRDALSAATRLAAESCGIADRKGTIGLGLEADLVAVGGDPLADPDALLDVRAVYRAGVPVESSTPSSSRMNE